MNKQAHYKITVSYSKYSKKHGSLTKTKVVAKKLTEQEVKDYMATSHPTVKLPSSFGIFSFQVGGFIYPDDYTIKKI